jgi:uncharacterized membrane protein
MDLRLSLQALAAQHQLSDAATARLNELAGIDAEPAGLQKTVPVGMAILGAALGGLGIIFWIAANWESLSRAGRFALLQAVIVTMCAGALFRPAARPALSLLALLAIGGLFAYFGQTYQTGADPWQLFAIWAALSLPLCLGVRHDALWAPWALIGMTAIVLWIHAHAGHAWNVSGQDLGYHLVGWSVALLLVFALSPGLTRYTGAGVWGMRVAVTLTAFIITWSGLFALFDSSVAPQFVMGLAVLGAAAIALCTTRLHDTFALSAIGLALNVLLVGGLTHLLFKNYSYRSDPILQTMLIGLVAAGMLAATVKLVVGVSRKQPQGDAV